MSDAKSWGTTVLGWFVVRDGQPPQGEEAPPETPPPAEPAAPVAFEGGAPAAPGGPQFRSLLDCAAQTVRGGGFKALYRGFGPAMVRAYPANAVCFAAYEAVVRAAG